VNLLRYLTVLALILLPQLAFGLPQGKPQLPNPMGYVSDHAGVIDPAWKERIRSVCQDLERKTGVEMVVVTVSSTKPYATARDYAEALYQRWGIGTAQKEHGVLVLAVIDPSAVRPFDKAQGGERVEPQAHRPEPGRGSGSGQATVTLGKNMLPIITPTIVAEVGSKYLEPAFRNAKFEEGLYRAVVALASASQNVQEGEPSRHKLKGFGVFLTVAMSLGALWFLWWISRPDLRHPYGRLRRGEFWGSGQGGFGSNFGGFGGGTNGEGLK
jgi:uncharacterized protein